MKDVTTRNTLIFCCFCKQLNSYYHKQTKDPKSKKESNRDEEPPDWLQRKQLYIKAKRKIHEGTHTERGKLHRGDRYKERERQRERAEDHREVQAKRDKPKAPPARAAHSSFSLTRPRVKAAGRAELQTAWSEERERRVGGVLQRKTIMVLWSESHACPEIINCLWKIDWVEFHEKDRKRGLKIHKNGKDKK